METKEQFQKILEWLKQINRKNSEMQQDIGKLAQRMDSFEKKMHLRLDISDERMDTLSDAIQSLLKVVKGVRVEQYNDRERYQKEIQKIRQEIRELTH